VNKGAGKKKEKKEGPVEHLIRKKNCGYAAQTRQERAGADWSDTSVHKGEKRGKGSRENGGKKKKRLAAQSQLEKLTR